MLSPAPGSKGLPTSGVTVTISYDPPDGALLLVPQGTAPILQGPGTVVNGGPFMAAPTADDSAAVASALPALAPHTTYSVLVTANAGPPSPCLGGRAGPVSFIEGTLSTQ